MRWFLVSYWLCYGRKSQYIETKRIFFFFSSRRLWEKNHGAKGCRLAIGTFCKVAKGGQWAVAATIYKKFLTRGFATHAKQNNFETFGIHPEWHIPPKMAHYFKNGTFLPINGTFLSKWQIPPKMARSSKNDTLLQKWHIHPKMAYSSKNGTTIQKRHITSKMAYSSKNGTFLE